MRINIRAVCAKRIRKAPFPDQGRGTSRGTSMMSMAAHPGESSLSLVKRFTPYKFRLDFFFVKKSGAKKHDVCCHLRKPTEKTLF